MADALTFHDKAKALRPNQLSKPTTFWVGVLNDSKKPEEAEAENDFLWLKCHKGVTVQTIRQQYMARNFQDEEVLLKYNDRFLDNTTLMRELNDHGDNLIAMEAVKRSDLPARAPRPPLLPSNAQVPAKPPSPAPAAVKPSLEPEARYASPYAPKAGTPGALYIPGSVASNSNAGQRRAVINNKLIANRPPTKSPLSERSSNSQGQVEGQHDVVGHREPGTLGWDETVTTAVAKARTLMAQDPLHTVENSPAKVRPNMSALAQHDKAYREELKQQFPWKSDDQIDEMVLHRFQSEGTKEIRSAISRASTDFPRSKVDPSTDLVRHNLENPGDGGVEDSKRSDIGQPKHFQLQTLLAGATPEVLEAAVETGVEILDKMKNPLLEKAPYAPDAAQWLQQIENVQKQAVKTKTIVGVVGNTGAGKSSVINAMLDEERLVPTNCMRACTAVVTEISYNDTEDPYYAEIEFITAQDWEKELKTLFEDLLDGNGNVSRDCVKEDTEAGVAYAKIRAVYPKKTKEEIANSSVKELVHHRDIVDLLGSSKTIKETDSVQFYKRLQHYVDSKEKSTGDDEKDKKRKRHMEYWPLIKVVRLYVKAPALSTGAVIVDLPGVHDSNAARAAVAEGYMKQCTGLWIVAPINRAVDDKAAKSLLGESFKRQLKMDGGFSSVTFICSKTDDISIVEAQDSLGLDEEMGALWEKRNSYENELKRFKRELGELKQSREDYAEAMEEAEEQLEIWETLKDDLESGKTVYAPLPKLPSGKKRKDDSGSAGKPRKRQRRSSGSDSDGDNGDSDYADDASDASRGHGNEEPPQEERGDPLTEEQVESKISELKSTKKGGRRQRLQLEEKIKALRAEMAEIENADQEIEAEMSRMCISGRNNYSKGAIQQDFAAGIRELDQELAVEEDEEHFDPSVEIRDYDEVARSLPVFCVSSRGYQKLQGRLRQDPAVPGFKGIEETGIPQLQKHCRQLTEKGRAESCRRFLNNLSQLFNSMSLWASNDGTGRNLTEGQKAREAKILRDSFKKLESGLEKVVETVCKDLKEEFADNIYDKYEMATTNATNEATNTASHWGAPVNRDDRAAGGYHWATYKAICRRNGVYSNAQGPHDWNVALADPMMKVLAPGWEKAFSRRAPAVTASFARNAGTLIKDFHREIETRARHNGANIAGLHMLQQQLRVYEEIFKDLANAVRETINTQQKDINREFIPVITTAMEPAYNACVEERGPGSFMRMKHAMVAIVDEKRLTMFRQSTDEVRTRLARMVTALEEMMHNKADEVHLMMRRDYTAVLGGPEIPKGGIMPKWQRDLRTDVMDIIEGSERLFKRVAGVEDEGEEEGDGGGKGKEQPGDDGIENELKLQDDDDEPLFRGGSAGSDDGTVSDHAMNGETKDIKTRDSPLPQERAVTTSAAETARAPPQSAQQRDPTSTAGTADTIKPETTDAHPIPLQPTDPFPVEKYANESFHPNAYDDDDEDDDEDNISVDSCGMPKGVYSDGEGEETPEEWESDGEWDRYGGARKKWEPGYGTYDMDDVVAEDDDDWPSSSGMSGLEEVDDDEEEDAEDGNEGQEKVEDVGGVKAMESKVESAEAAL